MTDQPTSSEPVEPVVTVQKRPAGWPEGVATPEGAILKPCPFDNNPRVHLNRLLRDGYEGEESDPDAYAYFVFCTSCAGQGGWAKSPGSAITRWNWREGNLLP